MRMTASWWVSPEATEYKAVSRHRPRTLAGSPSDRHQVRSIGAHVAGFCLRCDRRWKAGQLYVSPAVENRNEKDGAKFT